MDFKNFRVIFVSDVDYEDLVSDIYFENKKVAMLTQERGYENLEIEIYPPLNQEFWVFKFSEFEEAIQHAKRRLWELRKLPEDS